MISSSLTPLPPFSDIVETMELLPDADERLSYLISLGRNLPKLTPGQKSEENFVHGCQSSVWIVCEATSAGLVQLRGESDAMIVNGLIAITLSLYAGRTAQEILVIDATTELGRLQLDHHISTGRRNGLAQMIGRIRLCATQALTATAP
jgi:cysteine desulfuration protein SufE